MSGLFNLFPNIFGGGNGTSTNLSVGSQPELLGGNERSTMKSSTNLPAEMTQADVNKAATLAGKIEAQTVLLKEGSAQYLEVQKASLANLEIRVNHSKSSMQNTSEFQKKMSKHGKNIYEYQVRTEATKQNFDAYEQAFNDITVNLD